MKLLMLAGCPLFLYSASRVREILETAGIERWDWIDLDRDYVVVATLASDDVPRSSRER